MKNYKISLPVSSLQNAVAYSSNLTSITNGVGFFDGSSIVAYYDLSLTYSGSGSGNLPGQVPPQIDYAFDQANAATTLAQAAFNSANVGGGGGGTLITSNPANGITSTFNSSLGNTDLSLSIVGSTYKTVANSQFIPVITFDKFGRAVVQANAELYVGFKPNSVIYADGTTGKLANNEVFQYKSTEGSLYTPNIYLTNGLHMGNGVTNNSIFYMQYNPLASAMDFIFTI